MKLSHHIFIPFYVKESDSENLERLDILPRLCNPGENYTNCIFTNEDNFMFSSIIKTYVQKLLNATDARTKHIKRQEVYQHVYHSACNSGQAQQNWDFIKVALKITILGCGPAVLFILVGIYLGTPFRQAVNTFPALSFYTKFFVLPYREVYRHMSPTQVQPEVYSVISHNVRFL